MFQLHFFDSRGKLIRVSHIVYEDYSDAVVAGSRARDYQRNLPKVSRFAFFKIIYLVIVDECKN